MKRLLLVLISVIVFSCVKAQDIIVTTDADTINCKITRVGNEFVHFSVYDDQSGVILMRSRLPFSKISYYNQEESTKLSEPENDPSPKIEEIPPGSVYEEFDPYKVRLTINTGFTYQLGGYDFWPSSYKQQLQTLWNFGGDFSYFLSENIGIGAKYNHIYTRADQDFQPPYTITSIKDEKVTFDYVGVSLFYRNFTYDDQIVNYFIVGGIVNYRAEGLIDGAHFVQKGDTFGVVFGVSYDFIFADHIGVGLGGEVNIANLSEISHQGAPVSTDFAITRIDLTVGLRFYK